MQTHRLANGTHIQDLLISGTYFGTHSLRGNDRNFPTQHVTIVLLVTLMNYGWSHSHTKTKTCCDTTECKVSTGTYNRNSFPPLVNTLPHYGRGTGSLARTSGIREAMEIHLPLLGVEGKSPSTMVTSHMSVTHPLKSFR